MGWKFKNRKVLWTFRMNIQNYSEVMEKCSVLYSLHSFKFISSNFVLKLNSVLEYCKCELDFLKVTQFVFDFV